MSLSLLQPKTATDSAPLPVAASTPRAGLLSSAFLQANWRVLSAAFVIFLVGITLRVSPQFGVPDRLTVDEDLYMTNVAMLEKVGPFDYPAMVEAYVHAQSRTDFVMLPPTRFVYIALGWACDSLFHLGPRLSLRWVASSFSVLSLLLSGLFAFRLAGPRFGLAVSALMAVAPVELMLAHRELVDGVFAFWALFSLWLLWENLQCPNRLGWLAAYAGSIAIMVLTKENAFFAAIGLGAALSTATFFPSLHLGKPTRALWITTFVGGLLGLLVLISLAGSPTTLIETYRLLVTKAERMSFAYQSGGGPWYRYIIDLMLVSPTVLLPAIGGIFALRRDNRQGIFLLLFVVFSCAIMVNVKNGMNLRYATMWDMPLRFLAAGTLLRIASGIKQAPILAAVALVCLAGGYELHQYFLLFVHHDIGDPITQFLMYGTEIIRTGNPP